MSYTTAIFDMDGTILNTLEDLAVSANHALALHGMPSCSLGEARRNLGNGMKFLIDHLVPEGTPADEAAAVLTDFKTHYADHCADRTRPYPGIPELMDRLRRHGVARAVVSNKGDFAVQELVAQYFPGTFDAAVGEREGIRRKPAPDTVFAVMERLGARPADCVYVGDSEVDIQTAANAGIACVIVGWGFRDRAFLEEAGAPQIVATPDELLAAICA